MVNFGLTAEETSSMEGMVAGSLRLFDEYMKNIPNLPNGIEKVAAGPKELLEGILKKRNLQVGAKVLDEDLITWKRTNNPNVLIEETFIDHKDKRNNDFLDRFILILGDEVVKTELSDNG